MSTANTVLLKGDFDRYHEAYADGAITPGHILQKQSDGDVAVHATQGGVWDRSFAIENALQGPDGVNTTGNTIDDAYANGALVRYCYASPGDVINAILTTSQTISIGDQLTSEGNGRVEEIDTGDIAIGIAEEAVTTTGAVARLAMRVL